MAALKTLLTMSLLGALLGNLAALFFGRAFLPWYNTPGSDVRSQCDCVALVQGTVDSVTHYQFVGMGVGAIGFFVLGIFLVRARRSRPSATNAPPTPPPPEAPPPSWTGTPPVT